MAKTQEEIDKDRFERLQWEARSASSKLGKNGSSTKADGDENKYAAAHKALLEFGNDKGFTNCIPLKKKYLRHM